MVFLSQLPAVELLNIYPIWNFSPCEHTHISPFSSILPVRPFAALTLPLTMVDWRDPAIVAAETCSFILSGTRGV